MTSSDGNFFLEMIDIDPLIVLVIINETKIDRVLMEGISATIRGKLISSRFGSKPKLFIVCPRHMNLKFEDFGLLEFLKNLRRIVGYLSSDSLEGLLYISPPDGFISQLDTLVSHLFGKIHNFSSNGELARVLKEEYGYSQIPKELEFHLPGYLKYER